MEHEKKYLDVVKFTMEFWQKHATNTVFTAYLLNQTYFRLEVGQIRNHFSETASPVAIIAAAFAITIYFFRRRNYAALFQYLQPHSHENQP